MPQFVPLPHFGWAAVHTHDALGAPVLANLVNWFDQGDR